MNTLRGPLPTFGEKSGAPYQDSRAGMTGAAVASSSVAPLPGNAARGLDSSLEREVKSEGMRLVTEAELSRERDYWADQVMKMAMQQVQVTIRKVLSERDSERAESVQGDSGGSREGTAALTSRLNSLDLRMAGEEDKVNSALKKIEEVKAGVSMLAVKLEEERREREDTSKLAEMAVRTTRCIAEGGSRVSPAESMQSSLRSIDESYPLEEAQQDSGYNRIWEQLAAQIQRVAQELRTEVRKDVLGTLRTELTAETARQVAALQSKVGALESHVVSELKRFAAAYEHRVSHLESLQTDTAQAVGLPQNASAQNLRGMPMPIEGVESSGGTSKLSRSGFQDEWSNVDAASSSTVREDSAVHGEKNAYACSHIPQSLKNELQGLVDAVGNVISAGPDKPKGKVKPAPLMGKGGLRSVSPVSRQTSRAGRAASADPTSSLLSQQNARDSSADAATHSQASRGASEPPLPQQNQTSRSVSASSGTLPSSHTVSQSPFSGSRSAVSGPSSMPTGSLGGSLGGGLGGSSGSPSVGGTGSVRLGINGSPSAGSAAQRVLPTHGAITGGGSSTLTQPISALSSLRQPTPLVGQRVLPQTSPRMHG